MLAIIIQTSIFGVPFALYIAWGIVLIDDDQINPHVGFGILFLLFSVHLMVLGLLTWYIRRWRITLFSFICIGSSLFLLWLYLIFAVTTPKYFTYTGTSAVFLGFSFLPICYIHYRVDNLKNRVEFYTYMKTMEEEMVKKTTPGDILKQTRKNSEKKPFLWFRLRYVSNAHLAYVLYLILLAIYAILIWHEAEYKNSALGLINLVVIIVTDLILISWGYFSRTGYYLTPFKVILVVFATRIVLCIFPDYWILIHAIVFTCLLMLFVSVYILKNIDVESKQKSKNRKKKELIDVINNLPLMKDRLSNELEGFNSEDMLLTKPNRFLDLAIEIIPILLLIAAFIIYGIIIWAVDFNRAYAVRITVDKEDFHQGIFVGLGYAISASFILMAVWFRLFQLNNYLIKPELLVFAAFSYCVIAIIGILYGALVLDDFGSGAKTSFITAF